MPLTPGTTLGQHEVLESIGAGGMGEVYRARDTKLGRDVAIKVLPEEFARDKERLDRFEREARLLAQLNHSNIATLHGLEDHDGFLFFVMELVEGETLSERIAAGPLPVDEAIPLFIQIAEGLEAAHEKGIIHRDLKPSNIKIGPDGKPKILDFGLAKAFVGETGTATDSSQSPTLTKGTALGTIMGTASYMSPEQARGKTVDKRTDIWAFGCCLYEALTAKRAFDGETVTDIITAVVHKEPAWDALPALVPLRVRDLLKRMLSKDPRARLHDIADGRLDLEVSLASDEEPIPERPGSVWPVVTTSVLITAVVTSLIAGALARRNDTSWMPSSRFSIHLPPGDRLSGNNPRGTLALSPDGRTLVYEGERDGIKQLFRRSMDELESVPIDGTELARHPTISADGRWVAFFAAGELRKISLAGGAPVSLGGAPLYWGATWTEDEAILFGGSSGLVQIPADGGELETITTTSRPLAIHAHPQLLPDGETVLFTELENRRGEVVIQRRGDDGWRVLLEGFGGYLSPTGHLIFGRSDTLWAVPFDVDRLGITGEAVPVVEGVERGGFGFPQFAIGGDGTLVYVPAGSNDGGTLVLVNRSGEVVETLQELSANAYLPKFSPDGRFVLIGIQDPARARYDVWKFDLERGGATNLTNDDLEGGTPVWSPDGGRFAYSSTTQIKARSADGSGIAEPIADLDYAGWATSWSLDGKWLAINERRPETGWDALAVSLEDGTTTDIVSTPYNEQFPVFSPDGEWVAYQSDRSGRLEVYVRAFPEGEEHTVSVGGGNRGIWSKDGMELYYKSGTNMMVVDIDTSNGFVAGAPRVLFRGHALSAAANYDVSPDGERFVMVRHDETSQPRINVVLNWLGELERLVPARE